MAKKSALGRGFDVLMPTDLDTTLLETDSERVQKLFVSSIFPNPDQPRRFFDDLALEQLADSLKQYGVLQPLIVSPGKTPDTYLLIAGERRWRAAKLAGIQKVPAIVRTSKELEQLEVSLVENIQRVDLSPLETAVSIKRLHEMFSQSYDDIAKRLGKAPSTVNNIVRLLQLSPAAQEALNTEKISEGHARSILALKESPENQTELLLLIQKNGWSVRQAEQFVVASKAGAEDTKAAEKRTIPSNPKTEALSKSWNRPVSIKNMAKGGRLEIGFTSQEDLDKLIALLETLK
ncbi:MAG: Chromosome (plasmid) partitioning protein ParB [Candidatus Saccharibacteria bacterium]|nr:Chromosome (plasmid) partitioning protein ParB [Candidatus Saccharibacteria bacterium]